MKKNNDKKVVLAFSTLIASFGLFVASAFSSPTDLLENVRNDNDDDHNLIVEQAIKETKTKSFVESIPYLIRVLIGIPLWFIGTVLIKLVTKLFKILLTPIIKFILMWLLLFVALFVVTLIILKILFPDKSLKELISKKMIISLLCSSLAINIIDFVFARIFENYHTYRFLVIFILGLISIVIVIVPLLIKESRRPKLIIDDLTFK